MALPKHGPISCSKCMDLFSNTRATKSWGGLGEPCKLINNPGSWGAENPKYLVLGFSKGPKQNEAWRNYEQGRLKFEDVPFYSRKKPESKSLSMRERLQMLLVALGFIDEYEDINNLFHSSEDSLSFGSVIRCSISVQDSISYTEDLKKIISTFGKDSCSSSIISNCINNYLSDIPSGTIIVLLGMDKDYIAESKRIFCSLYRTMRKINALSYTDGKRTWIHVAHPSGRLADKHFIAWVNAENKSKKVRFVHTAIHEHNANNLA